MNKEEKEYLELLGESVSETEKQVDDLRLLRDELDSQLQSILKHQYLFIFLLWLWL